MMNRLVECRFKLSEEVAINSFQLSRNYDYVSIIDNNGFLTICALKITEDIETNGTKFKLSHDQEYRGSLCDKTLLKNSNLTCFRGAWCPHEDKYLCPQNEGTIVVLSREADVNCTDKWTQTFLATFYDSGNYFIVLYLYYLSLKVLKVIKNHRASI